MDKTTKTVEKSQKEHNPQPKQTSGAGYCCSDTLFTETKAALPTGRKWSSADPRQINNNNKSNRVKRRKSRFVSISSLRIELSPTCTLKWSGRNRVQITCSISSAYEVRGVVCHVVRRDRSGIKFDRVENDSILALFY